MKLSRIEIKNFRRIEYVDMYLSPATFIIGSNNIGKTSIIKAIDALLSIAEKKVNPEDFRIMSDGDSASEIEICGYFSDIDSTVANSRGFKGRVVNGEYIYKKIFNLGVTKPRIFTKQYKSRVKEEYNGVKKWQELIDLGIDSIKLEDQLGRKRPANDNLPKGWESQVEDCIEWDFDSEPEEIENPGGIPSNVVSKLPQLVHIPSYANPDDVGKGNNDKTILGQCLGILFKDLLSKNELATTIQEGLDELQKQMSYGTEGSMIYTLCHEVNEIIADVFPECGISIKPSLQDIYNVLKPQYSVEMFSNVNTDADRQGTGLVRTAIFSMLRYHSYVKSQDSANIRPLFVAFEEPEIYLHPSAANMLRETIYELGKTDQIVCTTHSPWMIDLSKDWQSLTKVYINEGGYTNSINYGLSEATRGIQGEERKLLQMIKTFDDELSRIFFAEKCIIVEGDSEVIAIKNTIKLLDGEVRKLVLSSNQVIKARGKATIIPLVKYLKALDIPFYVIHDRDLGIKGAEVFNQKIEDAVGNTSQISKLEECLENCLGYEAPSANKPYKVFLETDTWTSWNKIPNSWKEVFAKAFDIEHLVAL